MELSRFDLLLLLGVFAITWTFFFAWFFEKVFQWTKSTEDKRKRLNTQWHRLKAVIVGVPLILISYLGFGFNWFAGLVWLWLAFLCWPLFDFLLNKLMNVAPDHKGTNILDRVPWWVQLLLVAASTYLVFNYIYLFTYA